MRKSMSSPSIWFTCMRNLRRRVTCVTDGAKRDVALASSPVVDVEDDEHVPGQQRLNDRHAPLLKRFREHGVVSVVEHPGGNAPCLIPRKVLFIHENSHQLDNGERRVRVVELHAHEVWQLLQRVAARRVTA